MAISRYTGWTLLTVTTGSIQSYIYATNRLKDNAGASELARLAMEDWHSKPLPTGAKVVFVGGGNAAVLFPPDCDWRARIYEWSRKWLTEAPGLRLVTAAEAVRTDERLGSAMRRAQRSLRDREGAAPFGSWPGAFPVVKTCSASGAPASHLLVERDGETDAVNAVSNMVRAKRCAAEDGNERLRRYYPLGGNLRFPRELNDLRMPEGDSHIAVIHLDGNGIGKLFMDLLGDPNVDDDQLLERYGDLSAAVSTLTRGALTELLQYLESLLPGLTDQKIMVGDETYLPLRPLVEAGDDLTFVCHGRLGLHLAVKYLELFETRASVELVPHAPDHEKWTACAGVMIQPQKFPFIRGYRHAEQLTSNAKRARATHRRTYGDSRLVDSSWIDFQVIYEGAQNSLEETRSVVYGPATAAGEGENQLLMRPYALGGLQGAAKWQDFREVWRAATANGVPRSRAKQLLAAARAGKSAMKEMEPLWNVAGAELEPMRKLLGNQPREIWDALEMLDIFWEPESRNEPAPTYSNA